MHDAKEHTHCSGTSPFDPDGRPDDIDAYLATLDRESCYQVAAALGKTPSPMRTELVYFVGSNGAKMGPFVRKRIPFEAGTGSAYETIFELQRSGKRFLHLPSIVECYKTERELIVVLEYIPGETLRALVEREGGSVALAASIMPPICSAVAELHEACTPPVIHRDLTPSNIIIARGTHGSPHQSAAPSQGYNEAPNVFLIDLGIARRYRDGAQSDTAHLGTRSYAPPEQYGFGQTSPASDVYALGCLLFFCLTGKDPATQPTQETLRAHGVPERLARIVVKAVEFDPARRFQTARAFGEALSEALASQPAAKAATPQATPASGPTKPDVRAREADVAEAPRKRLIVGDIRNIAIALVCLAFLPQAFTSCMHPTPDAAGKPLIYNIVMYFGFCLAIIWGPGYLLLDKRRLHRRFPRLAARTMKQDALALALWLAAMFALLLAMDLTIV